MSNRDDTRNDGRGERLMSLREVEAKSTYTVKDIVTEDEEIKTFLFRLGCYSGEDITLISKKKNSCVVAIKEGRYSLDNMLAEAIVLKA